MECFRPKVAPSLPPHILDRPGRVGKLGDFPMGTWGVCIWLLDHPPNHHGLGLGVTVNKLMFEER